MKYLVAMRTNFRRLVTGCLFAFISQYAVANTYTINAADQLIGNSESVLSQFDDSLYSIALKHRVGADALANANPDINPVFPGVGAELRLPMQHILPAVDRTGIVINLPEMRLYYFSPDASSVSVYPVGIGRQGWETPLMNSAVSSIVKNPNWTPPASIQQEYRDAGLKLPDVVPAGPENPLGEYAIRIGQTSYLIHGTNNPKGVGLRVSHGCIRLYPEHIEALATELHPGTSVRVVNQPVKLARHGGLLYVQGHPPIVGANYNNSKAMVDFMAHAERVLNPVELASLKRVMREALTNGDLYSGVPLPVPVVSN